MTEQQRRRIGITGVVVGAVVLGLGSLAAHFTGLSPVNDIGQEIYPNIPRCAWFESDPAACWFIPTSAQLVAFVGSQILMGAVVVGWLWGRPLTWAGATMAAFLFTIEVILLFGVVPNQWLALTQGVWEWTEQRVAFTIPSWLVLNNTVEISFGTIKDAVAGGYSAGLLGAIAVGAYQLQERSKKGAQPKPTVLSTYGRPVVKGDR